MLKSLIPADTHKRMVSFLYKSQHAVTRSTLDTCRHMRTDALPSVESNRCSFTPSSLDACRHSMQINVRFTLSPGYVQALHADTRSLHPQPSKRAGTACRCVNTLSPRHKPTNAITRPAPSICAGTACRHMISSPGACRIRAKP